MERQTEDESSSSMQWKDTGKVKEVARRNGKKQTTRKQQPVAMERQTQDESSSSMQWKDTGKAKGVARRNGKRHAR